VIATVVLAVYLAGLLGHVAVGARGAYRLYREHGHLNFTVQSDGGETEHQFTPRSMALQVALEAAAWPIVLVGYLATRARVRVEYHFHGDARQRWAWERHAALVEQALAFDAESDREGWNALNAEIDALVPQMCERDRRAMVRETDEAALEFYAAGLARLSDAASTTEEREDAGLQMDVALSRMSPEGVARARTMLDEATAKVVANVS
jgi:hypothetical protein